MHTIKQIKNKLLQNIPLDDVDSRENVKNRMTYLNIFTIAVDNQVEINFVDNALLLNTDSLSNFLTPSEIELTKDLKSVRHKDITRTLIPTHKDKIIHFTTQPKKVKNKSQYTVQPNSSVMKNISDCLNGNKNYIIFDVEALETDQKIMLELGILEVKNGQSYIEHYIIEENLDLRNGRYVPDNKDNFNFGESKLITECAALSLLKSKLENTDFIIGHDISQDFKMLSKFGMKDRFSNLIDTATFSKTIDHYEGIKPQKKSIKNCLNFFNENHENLHNAGNDCVYNNIILEKIYDFNLTHERKNKIKDSNKKAKSKSLIHKL